MAIYETILIMEEKPEKQLMKFLQNINSEMEEDKSTREKYAKEPFKRETFVKLEFHLPILQALVLCKLITEMENESNKSKTR